MKFINFRCKKLSNAKKQITISHCPSILSIQLKRFDFTYSNKGDKINKNVTYPEKLDISPFTSDLGKKRLYDLYSVLVHSGSSCHSGHYYSYVKNSNGIWYQMNDAQV